jgi:hypothetical protein
MASYPMLSRGNLRAAKSSSLNWRLYAWMGRMSNRYYIKRAGRLIGWNQGDYWTPSSLVDRVLLTIDPGHPDLNANAVRSLLVPQRPQDPTAASARHWLFYWKIWRDLMEGRIGETRRALFPQS